MRLAPCPRPRTTQKPLCRVLLENKWCSSETTQEMPFNSSAPICHIFAECFNVRKPTSPGGCLGLRQSPLYPRPVDPSFSWVTLLLAISTVPTWQIVMQLFKCGAAHSHVMQWLVGNLGTKNVCESPYKLNIKPPHTCAHACIHLRKHICT